MKLKAAAETFHYEVGRGERMQCKLQQALPHNKVLVSALGYTLPLRLPLPLQLLLLFPSWRVHFSPFIITSPRRFQSCRKSFLEVPKQQKQQQHMQCLLGLQATCRVTQFELVLFLFQLLIHITAWKIGKCKQLYGCCENFKMEKYEVSCRRVTTCPI